MLLFFAYIEHLTKQYTNTFNTCSECYYSLLIDPT